VILLKKFIEGEIIKKRGGKKMILETARLILRQFEDEDSTPLHQIYSDPETMQFYPSPFSMKQTKQWMKRNQNRYKHDGFGLWAVCLKETEEIIGDCGLIKQQLNDEREVEVGYHINRMYWSNGYATEAARACKEYGFVQLGFNKLISIIDPKNTSSIRVAQKIGFTKEKEFFIFGKNHHIYAGKRTTCSSDNRDSLTNKMC
jgi:[ribosomal protein S5]-alanine N-acetyltransferase